MGQAIQPLTKPGQAPRREDADDTAQGLALFVLFVVAVLVVTAAVGSLALLTSWWVLGVAFAAHAVASVIVGTAVFRVLSDERSGQAPPIAA